MTLHGTDWSNHQPSTIKPTSNDRFVFILTSDGHSWETPKDAAGVTVHDRQVATVRKAKRVVGHYHWLRPGNIAEQVAWFLKCAKPKPGDVLICDWEQSGTTNRDKDQFIKQLQAAAPNNRVLLYCNTNYWLNYDKTSFVGDGLWIAEYDVPKPGIQSPWLFWQYTDKPIDQNRARFASKAQLESWAAKKTAPVPVPAPAPKPVAPPAATTPIHPTLDAIHTPFGQWGSSWSWNRGKNKSHPTWGQHGGDDWHRGAGAAEIGDPIHAVADGKVIFAGSSNSLGWGPAFGNHVLITWDDHIPGDPAGRNRTSIDAHMSKTVAKYGQHVKAGDLIGHKGMTGNVTGPHDHHEQHLGQGWGDKRVKPVYPSNVTPTPKPAPAPPTSKDWLDMATQQEVQAAFRAELGRIFGDVIPSPSLDPASVKSNPKWGFTSTIGWLTKLVSLIRRDMPTKSQIDELISLLKAGQK